MQKKIIGICLIATIVVTFGLGMFQVAVNETGYIIIGLAMAVFGIWGGILLLISK